MSNGRSIAWKRADGDDAGVLRLLDVELEDDREQADANELQEDFREERGRGDDNGGGDHDGRLPVVKNSGRRFGRCFDFRGLFIEQ